MNITKGKLGKKILVLGGTGKTGSRIVERLKEKGLAYRIGSRSANPKFDWEDSKTWKDTVKNIDSVYISFYPDLAVPGAVDTVKSFVETAIENGIKKIVLLSGRGEEAAEQTEQVVTNSNADWTILRCSWFNQNFSEAYLLEPIIEGFVALPAGNVGEPFVDADDIADSAVAALTEDGHSNQLYELTGTRLITFEEAINEIADAADMQIQYQQISIDDFTSALFEQNVPKEYIDLLTYLFSEVLDGRNENLTDGVQRVLGRKPIDFSEYARKTAATGIWNPKQKNGIQN